MPSSSNGSFRIPGSRIPLIGTVAVVLLCIAGYGLAMWVFWGPLIARVAEGASPSGTIKQFFLNDQLTYMSIISNVEHGRSAYIEPFTATGSSIYPSAYYWLVGTFARFTGNNAFFAYNAVGALATLLLVLTAGAWGRWATRSKWGWALGPIPLLIGTYSHFTNDLWYTQYGHQAMAWGPFAILFNPAAETPGLALAGISLLCLTKGLASGDTPDRRWLITSGAITGLLMNVHTYCFLFTVTVTVLTLLIAQLLRRPSRQALLICLATVVAGFVLVLSGVLSSPLVLLAVLLTGFALPLVIVSEWRKSLGLTLLGMAGAALLLAGPMLVRIGIDLGSNDSYFELRAGLAQADSLSLPARAVIFHAASALIATVAALAYLSKRLQDPHDRGTCAVLLGALVASTLLVFNAAWGMNQEPYRFFPYALFILIAIALPVVLRAIERRQLIAAVATVLAIALTVPTTVDFVKATRGSVLHFSPGERAAFAGIAAALPERGIALIDRCIAPRSFKVLTGTRVVDFNLGLAVPERYEEVGAVKHALGSNVIPPASALSAADVTSFVTMDHCKTAPASELAERFGAPTVIPLRDAEQCGLPPGTSYRIYSTANDHSSDETHLPTLSSPSGPVFEPLPGGPLPPGPICAIGPTP